MKLTIKELLEKIKTQDFSNASSEEIARIIMYLEESESLIEALSLQSRIVSLKQMEETFDLFLENLDFEGTMSLIFILLRLSILKLSVSKDLLDDIEFISKG